MKRSIVVMLACIVFGASCGSKIKNAEDKVYSRHLQKHIEMKVFSTPSSSDKTDYNLVVLLNGKAFTSTDPTTILDSIWKKKVIKPVILVSLQLGDDKELFGVAGSPDFQGRGKSAEKFEKFFTKELVPFIKKMSSIRKFQTVTITGAGYGGVSAFDIAWDNWQTIDKVAVFSGAFALSNDKAVKQDVGSKNNILIQKLTSSRRKPRLAFWLFAGGKENTSVDYALTQVMENTQEVINLVETKKGIPAGDITLLSEGSASNNADAWRSVFPAFLIWAAGN